MTSITLKNAHLPAPPKGKYPAKAHAKKVWQCILDARGGKQSDGREEVIYLESQKTTMIEVYLHNLILYICSVNSNMYLNKG